MRIASRVMVALLCLGCCTAGFAAPIRTPYAHQESLEIRGVELPKEEIRQFDLVEMVVELGATYDNPFDSSDVALDAELTLPDGEVWTVPGYFVAPFQVKIKYDREALVPNGQPGWRVRWTPPQAGEYTLVLSLRDRTGQRRSEPLKCSATASDAAGFVRISPRDRRYFEWDNGTAFYPIGLNMCWPGPKTQELEYNAWIPAFAKAGCNALRLWLAPAWNPLALERSGKPEDGLGLGQFDQRGAARLDQVVGLAQREGICVKLCFDSYNILRDGDAYPFWKETPHNAANGGPLQQPRDFWTNAEMERLYRDKLRYLVARYGAFTHVLAWEFWNEVDITSDYQTEPVRDWHQRMAQYLRSLDPYQHLITTSFARGDGDAAIDALPELDYVQTHRYGGPDPVVSLPRYQAEKEKFGKPHYVGEFGADGGGDRFADDPEGIQVHDSLWISVASGGSGAAQSWYWEQIHAHEMHAFYTDLAKFTAGIDWPAEQMQRIEPRVEWAKSPKRLPHRDLFVETTPPWQSPSEVLRPQTIQVDRKGARGDLRVAGIQHGVGGHKDKHNPLRLEIDLPWPTKFEVEVSAVSGWGGAQLELRLDEQVAVAKDFADTNPAGEHQDLKQYNGVYRVDVPAGKHVVEVENLGSDWFYCSYRLRHGLECHTPALLAWATAGQRNVLAWVRLEERSWRRVCDQKETVAPCPPSQLVLPQLASGTWEAEVWNTWTGEVLAHQTVHVGGDGEARLALPQILTDLAIRLRRTQE